MDWVAEGIAIGGWYDAQDHRALEEAGIRAVLQLYGPDSCPEGFPFAQAVGQIRVLDAAPLPPELLRQGVEFIREQRREGRAVLVCCAAGLSRSPTFVAAYLHEEGMDLTEAYASIRARRGGIIPHPELVRSLIEHYSLATSPRELLGALLRRKKAE